MMASLVTIYTKPFDLQGLPIVLVVAMEVAWIFYCYATVFTCVGLCELASPQSIPDFPMGASLLSILLLITTLLFSNTLRIRRPPFTPPLSFSGPRGSVTNLFFLADA
jgi:hypothetical protein